MTTYIWKLMQGLLSESRLDRLKKLYPGKQKEELVRLYLKKLVSLFLPGIIGILFFTLLFLLSSKQEGKIFKGNLLERPKPGGQTETMELEVKLAGERRKIRVDVPARRYTSEQRQAKLEEAKLYIRKYYLGANDSSEEIHSSLNLIEVIPGSAVSIRWRTDLEGYVGMDGSIAWEKVHQEQKVEITAVLSYEKYQEEVPLELTIQPEKQTAAQSRWEKWGEKLQEQTDETAENTYLELPEEIDGKRVRYKEWRGDEWKIVLGGGMLLLLMIPVVLDSRVKHDLEQRDRELRLEYPEILEQFVLLIGAGMTIRGAWFRIVREYEGKRTQEKMRKKYVYEEMLVSVREMENGVSETRAYELFGKRTGILSYMKFSALLVQNLRKGTADLLDILEYETVDAFRERKENARTLGEEASTRLLFPMMLMLVLIFAMILYSAFRSM